MFTAIAVVAVLLIVFAVGLIVGGLAGHRSEAMYRRRMLARAVEDAGLSDRLRVVQHVRPGGFEFDNTTATPQVRITAVP